MPDAPSVELTADETAWKDRAQTMAIVTADDYRVAGDLLVSIKRLRRRIEDHYDAILKPFTDAINLVRERRADDLDPVVTIEKDLGDRAERWNRAEQERVHAENVRRQQEQDALAQAQRESELAALAAAAEVAVDPIQRASAQRLAARLNRTPLAAPIAPQATVTAVAGLSYSVTYSARVVNLKTLCAAVGKAKGGVDERAVLKLDYTVKRIDGADVRVLSSPWLNAEARQQQDEFKVPGCVVVKTRTPKGR